MALIICPECGKEVSDKSSACIHCGYPISNNNTSISYNVIFYGFENEKLQRNNSAKVVGQLRQITNARSLSDALDLIKNSPSTLLSGVDKSIAEWAKQLLTPYGCIVNIVESNQNINNTTNNKLSTLASNNTAILCPRCGSSAISTGARGFSIITGFIGSGKTTNRCGSCGHTWQP